MSYEYLTPLEVNNFSGGKTDFYLEGPINQGQEFDNFYVLKNNKIKTRPGRVLWDTTSTAQIPSGNSRIAALIKHVENLQLFAVNQRGLYYLDTTWQTLTGPTSNAALSAGTTSTYHSWGDWKNHTIICNDSFTAPMKVYRDNASAYKVNNVGLPTLTLWGAITLANDLKSKYNAHIADVTEHTTAADSTNTITSANAYDLESLITLVTELVTDYTAHNADAEHGTPWLYHAAQNGSTHVLSSTTAPLTLTECNTLLDDLKSKFNAHDADGTSHGTDTLHQTSAVRLPTVTAGSTHTYLYRLTYYHEYYVGDVLFVSEGATLQITASSAPTSAKTISNLPVLANSTFNNYATSAIKIRAYRTIDLGTDFYYVGEVTNGTTSLVDSVSDATLVTNEPIYTTGGVKDNDQPPKAKYFTAVNDIGVYSHLKIGSQTFPNAFITTIPGDTGSAPADFQDEVEAEITGSSSVQKYPLLLCRKRIYRLEGIIDNQGRGTIQKVEVSKVKGTISNNGIVKIPSGIVFPAEDGFYFCDGFNDAQPLSQHLVESYASLVSTVANEKKIYGEYDSLNNRVLWTVKEDSSNSDCDSLYVLDLNFPMTAQSVFVTHSGQGDSFRTTALAFYNNEMVHADARGYILKYDDDSSTDLKVDTAVSVSSWLTYAIIWDYKSCAYSFGSSQIIKWVPIITLQAKNEGNTTIQINSNNNDSGYFQNLKEVRTRDQITWGDPNIIWNDTAITYYWNVARLIQAKRRFVSGSLRANLKQIQITNAYTIVYNSDTLGTCTTALANTATLSGSNTWPSDIAGYFISFSDDDYATDYEITARSSSTVITFSDTAGTSVDGAGKAYVIRGYRKGDTLTLLSYGIKYALVSQTQDTYKAMTGGNA